MEKELLKRGPVLDEKGRTGAGIFQTIDTGL